jgi:hypothetical protein
MRRFTHTPWAAALTLAVALVPGLASAQTADTLSISGTFGKDDLWLSGTVGDDLLGVYANGHQHTWTLTLHGLSYSHGSYYYFDSTLNYSFWGYVTVVRATSLDFQFFGPDADVLNAVVSQQLTSDGAYFEMSNDVAADIMYGGEYYSASWRLWLAYADPLGGVHFNCFGDEAGTLFPVDENGYPLVQPQDLVADTSTISDWRPGNYSGSLYSYADLVALGSSEPPVLPPTPPPPPPPPLPALSIADGSVLEGKKGTRRLHLNVTLSWSSSDVVTVGYTTAAGTALATSDYTATSGTLTFQPGQTSGTISISIKGDRVREPDETFTVQLSNAVGATIDDGFATATIRNDD